ncbi:MAG: tetratricopeptide repeat protein [Rhodospirillaceae bacterium]
MTSILAVFELMASGYAHLEQGESEAAEHHFRAAIAVCESSGDLSGSAEPRAALADRLAATGRWAEAAALFEQADRLEPDRPFRLAALAEARFEAGDSVGAAEACRRWLALVPDSAPARFALADSLIRLEERSAAADVLREALRLDSDHPRAACRLAGVLVELGDPLEALELVQPTLRRHPDHAGLHAALGRAWALLGESEKARSAWCRSLELEPDNSEIAASVAAAEKPAGMPESVPTPVYVRALFDRYADRFDEDLVGRLGYRAPEVLLEAVRGLPGAGRELDILDLGCGTGLAGAAFAPLAARLDGVDLSSRMIERARKRGLYHALYTDDLIAVLYREQASRDLIIAADVFNYLGDLGPVMTALAFALRPGGRAAATLEADGEHDTFRVAENRRVRHGSGHLRAAAAAAGLRLLYLERTPVRTERGEPVDALVFVLEAPAAMRCGPAR